MSGVLKYIVDDKGRRVAVLVPIQVWEDSNANYQKLQNKLDVLQNIQDGLKEVKQARKSGRKLQTLKDFLK
ncbi:MAG TPA: hypothetical protein VGE66_09690 [Chitinophagaceae bacterium]